MSVVLTPLLALILTSRMYQRLDVFHGTAVQNVASGIQIDAIYALNTVQYYDNGVFANNTYLPTVMDPPYECAAFTNVSRQTATSVEFRFSYVDTAGDVVGKDELTIGGTFSPNIAIDGTNKQCRPFKGQIDDALDLYYAGYKAVMNGTVIYVKYADGSAWRAAQI
ncbi:MAG TPA: hypothetical protein VMG98_08360 [Verrucomicrobiae bacterium]|nr:hypothetical protein [Verrucomicrobiae bacterium]HTZ54628.1 hypothetical protein [Candidatus Acidoferrum sp.]